VRACGVTTRAFVLFFVTFFGMVSGLGMTASGPFGDRLEAAF
jgi:hypothetical protein